MVGTNIGNTHRERQGTGLATVLDSSQYVGNMAAEKAAKVAVAKAAADEKKALAASMKKMQEFSPDYFLKHDQEMQGMIKGWMEEGAGYIRDNGADPWASTDDRALDWQKKKTRIEQLANNSQNVKKLWTEYNQVYNDPKKLEKLENKDEVAKYFDNPSISAISGQLPPRPKWKTPEIDTYKTMNEQLSEWDKANGKGAVMSEDQSIEFAVDMLNNPSANDGMGSFGSLQNQRFESLPDNEKKRLNGIAARKGLGDNGVAIFMGEQYRSHRGIEEDLTGHFAKLAQSKKLSDFGSGDGTNTVKGKYFKGGEKAGRKEIRAYLNQRMGQVEKDIYQHKMYGQNANTPEEMMDAAEDHYWGVFKAGIASGSVSEKKGGGSGGASKEDELSSRAYWRRAVKGEFGPDIQKEANAYMKGGKMEDGTTIDGSANLKLGDKEIGPRANLLSVESVKGRLGSDGNIEVGGASTDIDLSTVPDEALNRIYDSSRKSRKFRFDAEAKGGTENLYKKSSSETTDDLY
jgi:hypothetical protein